MKTIIGLETHVQLLTNTKAFCGCKNPASLSKDVEPNSLTCPTCLGLPGGRPRTNEKMVEFGIMVAKALNCKIPKEMFFSRKNYFYPDLPKNFQITQYDVPLGERGYMDIGANISPDTNILGETRIRISRVHLEEDPGRLVHLGGIGGNVLIDYNRSGIPLVEIVTEPDFSSPSEARMYLQKLALILEYLGVFRTDSKAIMKSDANISIDGGSRVEVKNITGDREIERALNYEIARQGNLVRSGQKAVKETRQWNPETGVTQEMRGKEEEEEYGYIFEPDLTRIELSREILEKIKTPELPDQKKKRYVKQFKLNEKVAEAIVSDFELAEIFECVAAKVDPKLAGVWVAGYLKKTLNFNDMSLKQSGIQEKDLTYLLGLFGRGMITDRNAEIAIRKMIEEKATAEQVVKNHGLLVKEVALEEIVKGIIEGNKKAAEDYRKGEKRAIDFLIGIVMKETKGMVEANTIRREIERLISEERRG